MARRHYSERREDRLVRKNGRKRSYDRMLIVCEGEKTEVNYFEAIRKQKRIPPAHIAIMPSEYGTSPLAIVDYAIDRFEKSKDFDKVYVVFDRDDHHSYHNALTKAAATDRKLKNDYNKKVDFRSIPSVPNFELWILLHYRQVFAPIHRDVVYSEIRKPGVYPTYQKNSKTVFSDTEHNIATAKANVKQLRQRYNAYSGDDPYTDIDVLTDDLMKIANRF